VRRDGTLPSFTEKEEGGTARHVDYHIHIVEGKVGKFEALLMRKRDTMVKGKDSTASYERKGLARTGIRLLFLFSS